MKQFISISDCFCSKAFAKYLFFHFQKTFRLDSAANLQELMDIYIHFQVYHSNELLDMKEWKEKNKPTPVKKMKKKTIRIKKTKEKKKKEPEIDPETGEPVEKDEDEENEEDDDEGIYIYISVFLSSYL